MTCSVKTKVQIYVHEPWVYCLNPVQHGSSTLYITAFGHMLLLANYAKSNMFPNIFSHIHILEEANVNETTLSSGNDWLM